MTFNDTIVAPATPPGVSALAIIRVSGPQVSLICQKIFLKTNPKPRHFYYSKAYSLDENLNHDKVLDNLTYVYLKAPNSFTGEDTLEIFPHGNPLIVKHLMQEILKLDGVRVAQAGEFTRRAFETGKIDLIQAEAVNDVIHAIDNSTLSNAHKLLEGRLSTELHDLADQVKNISAHLELEVDFAEEEADAEQERWLINFQNIITTLEKLQQGYKDNARRSQMPMVVVMGAPNAGKSSLINALLEEDRILVSNQAGTTRDFIEANLLLDRGEVRLVDTAGLSDNPIDELDRLSMEKSRRVIERADLILQIVDGTSHREANSHSKGTKLPSNIPLQLISSKLDLKGFIVQDNSIAISAKTGEGVDLIKNLIDQTLFSNQDSSEDFWLANERQSEGVSTAISALSRAIEFINQGVSSPEILAFELQIARDSLSEIIGEISTDDILKHIFSGFCIGK